MGVTLARAVLAHRRYLLAGRNEEGYAGAGRMDGHLRLLKAHLLSEYSGRLFWRVAPWGNLLQMLAKGGWKLTHAVSIR
jgi:hypothetical protein